MENNVKNYLSVFFLLSFVLKKIPIKLLQYMFQQAMLQMHIKHEKIFNKLSEYKYDFIINPTDFPYLFYMNPDKNNPKLSLLKKTEKPNVSATVIGSLENLFLLFEGKLDGDAAFFSKDLIIEGSTEAILTLRNSLESENINIIEDLSEIASPFEDYLKCFLNKLVKQYNNNKSSLDSLSQALLHNVNQSLNNQSKDIDNIYEEMDILRKDINSIKKDQIRKEVRKKSDYNKI